MYFLKFGPVTRLLTVMLFAITCATTAFASSGFPISPRPRLLDARDGLPSLDLGPVAIDRQGYVWIATNDGLARYDGMGFRVWRHHPNDPHGLQSNAITGLATDNDGRLWISTSKGLSVLDAGRKTFRTYLKADYPEIGSDDIWNVSTSGKEVWFGTASGLHCLKDGQIKRYVPIKGDEKSLPGYKVISILIDDKSGIWVTTSGGLARFDGQRFHRYPLPGTSSNFALRLSKSRFGLWVSTTEGLVKLHSDGRWETPPFSKLFAVPNLVAAMVEDEKALWILGYKGIWRVTDDGNAFQLSLDHEFESLRGSIVRQRDGSVWFSVSGLGVGYFPPSWRALNHYSRARGSLRSDVVYDLGAASGGGVLVWGNANHFESIGVAHKQPAWWYGISEHLGGSKLMSFYASPRGQLWLGTHDRLLKFSATGGVDIWRNNSAQDPAISGAALRVVPGRQGDVWIAFEQSALQQRDANGHVLQKVPLSAESSFQIDEKTIRVGSNGTLFAAANQGLAAVNRLTRRFEPVAGIDRSGSVSHFNFDHSGRLWLHRIDRLEELGPRGGGWQLLSTFNAKQGFPVASARDLVADSRGRVWWSTARGVFRWDPVLRKLRRFGRADGLSSEEAFTRMVLGSDGMLVTGMADGSVIAIDTLAPDEPRTTPTLVVSQVDVRRDGGWQVMPDATDIVLRPGDRELRVQMRLLAYQDPATNRYFTRLDGYDRHWIEHQGSDRGERIFANLPAGDYALRARALDARGTAAREQVIRFKVMPVWWRTHWAMAGFFLVGMLGVWWALQAYRIRLSRRASWQQAQRERQLAYEASLAKTRFLATLGHEVRTPMTGVLGMSELLLGTKLDDTQRGYTEAIHGAGEHLVRLVNDALDLSRIESGKLELLEAPFDVRVLVGEVAQLMAPLAQRKALAFDVSLDPRLPVGVVGDVNRVRQILLNLLGNAIKFTEAGRVWLTVEVTGAMTVRFEIGDTGPGLNEEQASRLFRRFEQAEGAQTAARYGGSGLGLAICQELAAVMRGAISVLSRLGQGTRFIVDLPLPATDVPVAVKPALDRVMHSVVKDVLLVEDDSIVAEVIGGLLRSQGHHVTHVSHGLAALQETCANRFDLVLLDLDLPGIDGFALALQLRSQGFEAPMVALTARADMEASALALKSGCDRFLRKPITGAVLAQLLIDLEQARTPAPIACT